MLPQILSATPLEVAPFLVMIGFGMYHGLNPGMGWLFALSLGLQRRSERAIWVSLLPISIGHAASLMVVAIVVMAGAQFISTQTLQMVTALVLVAFGLYKIVKYYRHPRWVGMQVSLRDLTWWSFLMAMAHGAGLMIAPVVLALTAVEPVGRATMGHDTHATATAAAAGWEVMFGVLLHTASMLAVMAVIAWVVYRKVGLAVLRRHWVNFDVIWAAALLFVGAFALLRSLGAV